MMEAQEKNRLLGVYLDPELFEESEAKEELREAGYDVERIEERGDEFLSRLKAKEALAKGRLEREAFTKMAESFPSSDKGPNEETPYALAARKGECGENQETDNECKALFEELKKRKAEKGKEV